MHCFRPSVAQSLTKAQPLDVLMPLLSENYSLLDQTIVPSNSCRICQRYIWKRKVRVLRALVVQSLHLTLLARRWHSFDSCLLLRRNISLLDGPSQASSRPCNSSHLLRNAWPRRKGCWKVVGGLGIVWNRFVDRWTIMLFSQTCCHHSFCHVEDLHGWSTSVIEGINQVTVMGNQASSCSYLVWFGQDTECV